MTDVAVKIGIVERELRIRSSDRMLALLLSSAEQDCLRIKWLNMRYVTVASTRLALLSAYVARVGWWPAKAIMRLTSALD